MSLYNLRRVSTSTTGTGTITLGATVTGFKAFTDTPAIPDQTVVQYAIADTSNSEIGTGLYSVSGSTLTRTVIESTNSNTPISLSGNAQVFITPSAGDLSACGISIMSFGAKCDGVTDDSTAIQAALNSGATLVSCPPGMTSYCSAGISIPHDVTLQGFGFIPDSSQGSTPGGFTLSFALATATCVTLTGNAGLAAPGIRGVTITRAAGTVPASSVGLYVSQGYNAIIEDVLVSRHDIGLYMKGGSGGISCSPNRFYTQTISDAHIVLDHWPEFRLNQSRIGSNGTYDVAGTAYVRFIGSGTTPNTVALVNSQFNIGVGGTFLTSVFQFTSDTQTLLQFSATGCHFENFTNVITTDSSTVILDRMSFAACTFIDDAGTANFWNLGTGTTVNYFHMNSCNVEVGASSGGFIFAPTPQFNEMSIGQCDFLGAVSITGVSSSTVDFSGCGFSTQGLTVAGAFDSARFNGACQGTVTCTATTPVEFDFANDKDWQSWTPAITFGGGNTGITYTTQRGRWKMSGGLITAQFELLLSSKGSSTGTALLTGLPFTPNSNYAAAGGSSASYFASMSSLTPPLLLSPTASSTVNIYQGGSTGIATTSDTNFTNTSAFYGQVNYAV